MHSGNAATPDNPSFATIVGIAALVLEGRPTWEGEYDDDLVVDVETSNASAATTAEQPKPQQHHQSPTTTHIETNHSSPVANTSLTASVTPGSGSEASSSSNSSSSSSSSSGSPNNSSASSSSSAANNNHHHHHVSSASSRACSRTILAAGGSSTGVSSSSSSDHHSHSAAGPTGRSLPKALRDETVQKLQRLRQKLMHIRSAPGSTSREAVQHAIAVCGGGGGGGGGGIGVGAVDDDDDDDDIGGNADTEASSSAGNLMPMDGSDDEPDDGFAYVAPTPTLNASSAATGLLSTLQALATNSCINATSSSRSPLPRPTGFVPSVDAAAPAVPSAAATAGAGGIAAEKPTKVARRAKMGPHCEEFLKKIGLIKTPDAAASAGAAQIAVAVPTTPRSGLWLASPKVPYVKVHQCNKSASCTRWQGEFQKMMHLFARGDAVCIDVYLGPDHDAILLEQWMIQQCDRTNQMTMTLPSLCSAIRSQLYFSQISAWTEQLKTASAARDALVHEKNGRALEIGATGLYMLDVRYRIRAPENTASFASKPNVHNFPDAIVNELRCVKVSVKSLPRLDAIPRAAALPIPEAEPAAAARKTSRHSDGGLPAPCNDAAASTAASSTVANAQSTAANVADGGGAGTAAAAAGRQARHDMATTSQNAAPSASLGRRQSVQSASALQQQQQQQQQQHLPRRQCTETGKHKCTTGSAFDEDRCSDEMPIGSEEDSPSRMPSSPATSSSPLDNPLLAHRTRQLQKYRKRLLRRDQKRRAPAPPVQAAAGTVAVAASSSSSSSAATSGPNAENAARCSSSSSSIADGTKAAQGIGQISINSIRPPLYSAMDSSSAPGDAAAGESSPWRQYVETKSIGTQTLLLATDEVVSYPNCDLCGIEMQYVCWNCDRKLFDRWSSRPASPSPLAGQSDDADGGERLLQSIQRTPSFRQLQLARQRKQQAATAVEADDATPGAIETSRHVLDNDMHCDPDGSSSLLLQQQQPQSTSRNQHLESTCASIRNGGVGGGRTDVTHCRLCKRQKTAHNYFATSSDQTGNIDNNNSLTCSYNSMNSNHLRNNNNNIVTISANGHHDDSNSNNGHLNNEHNATQREESMPLHTNGSGSSNGGGIDDVQQLVQLTSIASHFHRRTMSESLDSTLPDSSSQMLLCANDDQSDALESHHHAAVVPLLSDADQKLYRRAFSEDVLACGFNETDARAAALFDLKRGDAVAAHPPVVVAQQASSTATASAAGGVLFKTPAQKAAAVPHQLTISTSNRDLYPCSPSASISAMSLDSPKREHSTITPPSPPPIGYVRRAHGDDGRTASRPLPKVNLNTIFGNGSSTDATGLPVDSSSVFADGGTPDHNTGATANEDNEDSSSSTTTSATTSAIVGGTVHKSNSAPSFATVNAGGSAQQQLLSPRFLKLAAIQKRRSRHLSDRSSERSSIGSDELMSDEEFGASETATPTTYMVMLAPHRVARGVVRKPLPKSYPFGRRTLLASIEESLLQRCFVPTFHVPGFKVLLGASGCFCPTQLTIPSSTSFYELQGQCLSTPYMCEIRMPRKGYSIPRVGTVQATLLNPHGLVVRMFVVPYDLRDMPNMHQTFIRQRVLAFDERLATMRDGTAANVCGLTTGEQMKLLRYAIHLRFQTTRSGRLVLHTDIRMVISRRTDCDTAAAHAKGVLEAPNELKVVVATPEHPRYSLRLDKM